MKKQGFLGKLLNKNKNQENEEESIQQLNGEAKDMIRGIVELSETTVKEVMVPRIDVVFVSLDMPMKDLLERVAECGHSRVPVFKETIDNVVGVLYVKDLMRSLVKNEEINIEKIIRNPYFVPESKRIDSLLREFKRKRVHIAVAVDEYGGVSGIVCLEDIIEEIIGDIQDEFDNESEDILTIGEGVYLVDTRINIEDLNEQPDLQLPEEDFDTLGGFVFDLFGKIPVRYEKVSYKGADFIIQNMDGHKIKTVKIVMKGEKQRE